MLRPTAIDVKILDDFKLYILFDNKEKKIFDAKKILSLKPYKSLSETKIFSTAKPNGITIEWDGEIDICPDFLYEESVPY